MNADLTLLLSGLLAVLYGLVACFFGWRVFRFALTVAGFLIGGLVGYSLGNANLLIGLIGALIGAFALYALFRIGIFIAGALLFALAAASALLFFGITDSALQVVGIIAGAIAGGLVALGVQSLIIVASTAFGGAASLIAGVALVFPSLNLITTTPDGIGQSTLGVIVWLLVGVIGFLFQYRDSNGLKKIKTKD